MFEATIACARLVAASYRRSIAASLAWTSAAALVGFSAVGASCGSADGDETDRAENALANRASLLVTVQGVASPAIATVRVSSSSGTVFEGTVQTSTSLSLREGTYSVDGLPLAGHGDPAAISISLARGDAKGVTVHYASCVPTSCVAKGANCGTVSDGCGGTLNCGTCAAPSTCGGGGVPNVCGSSSGVDPSQRLPYGVLNYFSIDVEDHAKFASNANALK